MQIIVGADSGIETIEDLRERALAFTDSKSNSGFKVPIVMLKSDYNMLPGRDYAWRFTYSHFTSIAGTEEFCAEGLGGWPHPVFSNQAALIGPMSDPARIGGVRDAVEAFRRIALSKSPFVVNNSATEKYLTELLWNAAGKPDQADWYRDKGLRNRAETKDAIQAAVHEKGYTLWGLVPFLQYRAEHPDCGMKALVTDDPLFQRVMVAVVVQPEKIKGVNVEGAKALERFLIEPETQARIRAFRVAGFSGQVWWPAGRNNSGAFLKGDL